MRSVVVSLLVTIRASLRARAALQLEILALRHQLNVVNRSQSRRLSLDGSFSLVFGNKLFTDCSLSPVQAIATQRWREISPTLMRPEFLVDNRSHFDLTYPVDPRPEARV